MTTTLPCRLCETPITFEERPGCVTAFVRCAKCDVALRAVFMGDVVPVEPPLPRVAGYHGQPPLPPEILKYTLGNWREHTPTKRFRRLEEHTLPRALLANPPEILT